MALRVSPHPTTRIVSPVQSRFFSGTSRPSGSVGEPEALGVDDGVVPSGPAFDGADVPVVKPTITPAVTPTRADTRSAAVPRAFQRMTVRLDRGSKGCLRSSTERPQSHRAEQLVHVVGRQQAAVRGGVDQPERRVRHRAPTVEGETRVPALQLRGPQVDVL